VSPRSLLNDGLHAQTAHPRVVVPYNPVGGASISDGDQVARRASAPPGAAPIPPVFREACIVSSGTLYRLSAFTTTPEGGNPAGVWIGDRLPGPAEMQRIAADVRFSETAFVAPREGTTRTVRYYSPLAEVPFCGHATIAAGVQLGESSGEGEYRFEILPGSVMVRVSREDGSLLASLTSVEPRQRLVSDELLDGALAALGWSRTDLDDGIAPINAYAGVWHLVIAVRELDRLNRLDYDFQALQQVMLANDLTTLQLIWRESDTVIHARDPFPVGGVVEDPATGAAAAALGGYLRDAGLVRPPTRLLVRQGEALGRPSRLIVDIPPSGGIIVSGHAVRLPAGVPPVPNPVPA
jgi:PhzF family phenazine biosynthesis protein